MGMEVKYDHKFTQKERDYLIGHGFSYRVDENDRVYGKPEEPDIDEGEGLDKRVPAEPMASDPPEGEGFPIEDQGRPVNPDQFAGLADDEEGIDEDIADYVSDLTVDELKSELDGYDAENEPDDDSAKYKSADKKDDLAERLANVLQDKRDAGEEVDLSKE